jgi:hypothetical protein
MANDPEVVGRYKAIVGYRDRVMLIDEEDLTKEGDMANTKEVITYITITNTFYT